MGEGVKSQPPLRPPHQRAHLLAAAGLLHDVGKVGEPAGIDLRPEDRNLESSICPVRENRYTHRHVLWTARAIDLARTNWGGLDRGELFRVASYHHRPSNDSLDQWLLQQADHLASGHDRRSGGEEQTVTGLFSIFPRLVTERSQDHGEDRQLPTSPMGFGEEAFLPGAAQDIGSYRERCRHLAAAIDAALGQPFSSPRDCVDGLLGITERLLHAVPSSRYWKERPDVGLFDHSRAVAAFAACLALDTEPSAPRNADAHRFRLLAVSLGGIQDFIFRSVPPVDMTGGGGRRRAKQLRARSFYVSLLSLLSAVRVLDAIGLPLTNLVFHAGGRAILLLPGGSAHAAAIDEAVEWVREWFFRRLGGIVKLRVANLAGLTQADFSGASGSGFAETYRRLIERTERARVELPVASLRADGQWSEGGWVGDGPGHPADAEARLKEMAELGQRLPRAAWLALDGDPAGAVTSLEDVVGYRVALFDRAPGSGRRFALHAGDAVAGPLFLASSYVPVADERMVAALASHDRGDDDPVRVGDPVTFADVAHLSQDDSGRAVRQPMLGVLKADVDRLGLLMGYGLPTDHVSFGRLAALSRSLDLFFKGFLDHRVRERYRNVYTVFAGGDDLLLIGPWYDVVRLAGDLRRWFQLHVCGRPGISLSAGLVFTKPTTPVRQLAALADAALDAAKDGGRGRVTIAGTTLEWEAFDETWRLHRLMLDARRDGGRKSQDLPPAFVYRLLGYAKSALRVHRGNGEVPLADVKWRAQLNYDVKRNYPKGHDDAQSPSRALRDELLRLDHTRAAALHAATMLTLYVMRGER